MGYNADHYISSFSDYLLNNYEEELKQNNIEEIIHKLIGNLNSFWAWSKNIFVDIKDYCLPTGQLQTCTFFNFCLYFFRKIGIEIKACWFMKDPTNPYLVGNFIPNLYISVFDFPESLLIKKENLEGLPKIVLEYYPNTELELPNECTSLGCFHLYNLKTVKFNTNTKNIRFSNCSALEQLIVPEGVEVLAYDCFCNCVNLKNLILPKSIQMIRACSFKNTSLTEITYLGTKENWEQIKKESTWRSNSNIVKINCSDGVLDLKEDEIN